MFTHKDWLPILPPPFSFWQPLTVSTHPVTSHLGHGVTAGESVGALLAQGSPVDDSTLPYTVSGLYFTSPSSLFHPVAAGQ